MSARDFTRDLKMPMMKMKTKMAKDKCILCGNSIFESSMNDQNICVDCERENSESRLNNN